MRGMSERVKIELGPRVICGLRKFRTGGKGACGLGKFWPSARDQ